MKICLINNLYWPFARGGAEKVVETLAHGLINSGHEIFIVTTKPFGKFPISNFQFPIYYLNSSYYNLNKLPKFLRWCWHIWDMFNFINYFKVKKILQTEKCQWAITNNLMGVGFLTVRAVKKINIKLIHIVHDIQLIHPSGVMYYGREKLINSYFARNYAGLMSRLIDSPAVVIFPSQWLMNLHLEKIFFIKSKRIVLPNPVELIKPAAAEKKDPNIFKFLFIGQLEKHKGVFQLIKAFKKIKNHQASLIIAGSGSKFELLQAGSADDKRIKFLGRINDEKINQLLMSADCLVYPSICYENCPNVLQRAQAAGLAVIGSDLGGISELLGNNAGLLVNPADTSALAEKMRWALDNRDRLNQLATAGKEKAKLYRLENYLKELDSQLK